VLGRNWRTVLPALRALHLRPAATAPDGPTVPPGTGASALWRARPGPGC